MSQKYTMLIHNNKITCYANSYVIISTSWIHVMQNVCYSYNTCKSYAISYL